MIAPRDEAHTYTKNEAEVESETRSHGITIGEWQRHVTGIEMSTHAGEHWVLFADGSNGLILPSFGEMIAQLVRDYTAGSFALPCMMWGRSFACGDAEVVTGLRAVTSQTAASQPGLSLPHGNGDSEANERDDQQNAHQPTGAHQTRNQTKRGAPQVT